MNMSIEYRISQLLMNNEQPFFEENERLKEYRKVKKVPDGDKIRYLTWIDDTNMESIKTPQGRELTPEELFDFILGNNITDLARTKNIDENKADIAIVLGNSNLSETKERAIKAFELYKLGIVKKIIFTDVNNYMHPKSIEEYMDNSQIAQEWSDLPEADWGAETFIPDVFKKEYDEHSLILTEDFLRSLGINPEDIITESVSKSTQENAEFCKNIFESEELETGMHINSAVIVTTCTHGSRAMRQFKKVFGNKISLKWCPSTLDLEKYENLKNILKAKDFDEKAFREELKRVYCTTPKLIKKLQEETANHRNAFILGDIDDPKILTMDREKNEDKEH